MMDNKKIISKIAEAINPPDESKTIEMQCVDLGRRKSVIKALTLLDKFFPKFQPIHPGMPKEKDLILKLKNGSVLIGRYEPSWKEYSGAEFVCGRGRDTSFVRDVIEYQELPTGENPFELLLKHIQKQPLIN